MNRKVAYYITGHGFGHATRSIELVKGLLAIGNEVSIVSSLTPHFFLNELSSVPNADKLTVRQSTLDTGGIQIDAIRLDPLKSVIAYTEQIHAHRSELLQQEVEFVQSQGINLILIDATPLASAIAKAANILSIYVTNFTWDFVFVEMLQMVFNNHLAELSEIEILQFQEMITQCQQDVGQCTAVIHYPGQAPMNSLISSTCIFNGPLICRPILQSTLRSTLGISSETKLLLLGFGGHTAEWQLKDEYLPIGWECLVLRANPSDIPSSSSRWHILSSDVYVPDYIHAVDVVLGKIGYGFVSECLSAGTPLIYVPRIHWPEEIFLENILNEYHAGIKMNLEEFQNGLWSIYLEEAYKIRRNWKIDQSTWLDSSSATNSVLLLINQIITQYEQQPQHHHQQELVQVTEDKEIDQNT
jgi:L-arabinokinase